MNGSVRDFAAAVLGLSLALCHVPARADGIVMKPHEDGWRPGLAQTQQAVITHGDGVERLIVAVDIKETEARSMVWLLPVPAAPKEVKVDVLASFPMVTGIEVYGGALEYLGKMRWVAVGSQIWPGVLALGGALVASLYPEDPISRPKTAAKAEMGEGGVAVHTHIEKEGMTVELIEARLATALYDYLQAKGLKLAPGALPALDFYVGKNYSFIASWVTSNPQEESRGYTRGIDIRFPTKELFFPLLPTSAYGDRVVPASIRVSGFVTPRTYAGIERHMRVAYHLRQGRGAGDSFEPAAMTRYTRIDIDAPAKDFTQDLWISLEPPNRDWLDLAALIAGHPVVAFFALLLPLSILVSVIAGAAVYRELRNLIGLQRLALIGLGNGVSLIGVLLLTMRMPTGWKRRAVYLFFFSLLFLLAFALATKSLDALLEPMKPPKAAGGKAHFVDGMDRLVEFFMLGVLGTVVAGGAVWAVVVAARRLGFAAVVAVAIAIGTAGGGAYWFFAKEQQELTAAVAAAREELSMAARELRQAQAKQWEALQLLEKARATAEAARNSGDLAKLNEAQQALRLAEAEVEKQAEVVKQREAAKRKADADLVRVHSSRR